MTIASLIVDVAANTAKLTKDVEEVHGKLDRITSVAGTVGKALTAAFTVTAIIGATKQVLDHAVALTDLAAKTGISTTGLQKFDLAFKASGVSLDTVSASVTKLANNIVGGDKSAVGALEKMGVSVTALKGMAPEQQFTVVADAIGKIPNPTERAYAAMQVFGKGGAELLQALDGHLAETTKGFEDMGLIINEQTIAAADRFGDQLELLQSQMTAAVAQGIGPMLPSFSQLIDVLSRTNIIAEVISRTWSGLQLVFAATMSVVFSVGLAISTVVTNLLELASKVPVVGEQFKGMAASARETTTVLGGMQQSFHDQAAEAWEGVKGNNAHQAALNNVKAAAQTATPPMQGFGTATDSVGKAATKAERELEAYVDQLYALNSQHTHVISGANQMAVQVPQITHTMLSALRATMPEVRKPIENAMAGLSPTWLRELSALPAVTANSPAPAVVGQSLGSSILGGLKNAFTGGGGNAVSGIFSAIQGALQGGGNVLKSVGASLGGSLTKSMFGGPAVQQGITSIFRQTLGGAFNAILPGVGTLVGPLIGKISSMFKGLFGPSAQELGGRNAAAEFKTQVESMLSDAQKLELAQNNVSGALEQQVALHIKIRDAAQAAGLSRVDADTRATTLVKQLWEAEKQGGSAVQRVIEQINQTIGTGTTSAIDMAGQSATNQIEAVGTAAAMTMDQVQSRFQSALSKIGISGFVRGGGGGSATGDESSSSEFSVAGMLAFAKSNGIADIGRLAAGGVLNNMAEDAKAQNWAKNFMNDHAGWVESEQQKARDAENANNWQNQMQVLESAWNQKQASLPGFATGTGGQFMDFGSGTNVTLHGRERVVTEAEGAREASGFGAMVGELAEIRAALKMLPKQLTAAMQTAM